MLRISMRGALPTAIAVLLAALAGAGTAPAHRGGDPNYISQVRSVTPAAAGLSVQVLDRDDRLEARLTGSRTVVIEGYNGEPYARLSPGGGVDVNRRSPAHYLNQDRLAQVDLPAVADEKAPPDWRRENGTGRFEWHDHRMHWMAKGRPEKVRDPERRTRVFDWKVPLRVDGRAGAIAGRLDWVPQPDDGPPPAAWYALAALGLAGAAAGVAVRRRRRARGSADRAEEAW
jgi:MYXO-CTERM domain-containing protein